MNKQTTTNNNNHNNEFPLGLMILSYVVWGIALVYAPYLFGAAAMLVLVRFLHQYGSQIFE